MDKEEQIKKMAYSICTMGKISEYITDCTKCGYSGEGDCKILKYARKFYENGYRKQSDTVREFVERLLKENMWSEKHLIIRTSELYRIAKEYGAEVEE